MLGLYNIVHFSGSASGQQILRVFEAKSFALFSAGGETSKTYAPIAVKAGAVEIRWRDSGRVNRHRRMVALGKAAPLTIAEILAAPDGVRATSSASAGSVTARSASTAPTTNGDSQ